MLQGCLFGYLQDFLRIQRLASVQVLNLLDLFQQLGRLRFHQRVQFLLVQALFDGWIGLLYYCPYCLFGRPKIHFVVSLFDGLLGWQMPLFSCR